MIFLIFALLYLLFSIFVIRIVSIADWLFVVIRAVILLFTEPHIEAFGGDEIMAPPGGKCKSRDEWRRGSTGAHRAGEEEVMNSTKMNIKDRNQPRKKPHPPRYPTNEKDEPLMREN